MSRNNLMNVKDVQSSPQNREHVFKTENWENIKLSTFRFGDITDRSYEDINNHEITSDIQNLEKKTKSVFAQAHTQTRTKDSIEIHLVGNLKENQ